MHSAPVFLPSLWAACATCNAVGQTATDPTLQNWDLALMAAGALLALLALIRGYARFSSPVQIDAANRGSIITPELLLLPVLAYLGVLLAAYALLSPLVKPIASTPEEPQPFDLVALLANNLALLTGGAVCWFTGRKSIAGSGGSWIVRRGSVVGDVLRGAAGAVAAIALCQATLYLTCRAILMFSPDYVFHEHGVIDALRDPQRPVWLPFVLWLGVVGITPAAEELFFRGLLQTALLRRLRSPWLALVAAGLFFGLAHGSQPQVIPALTVFGVILGILYLRTGALLAPIVAHALFNAKTLLWEALAPLY